MQQPKIEGNALPESELLKALFSVNALVTQDVIQKAKQHKTLIIVADEHGNIQRLHPESFETPSQKQVKHEET